MCDVTSVVKDAFENARFLCDRYYLTSPALSLEFHNSINPDKKISIVAVPSHLYHIMFELVGLAPLLSYAVNSISAKKFNARNRRTHWHR